MDGNNNNDNTDNGDTLISHAEAAPQDLEAELDRLGIPFIAVEAEAVIDTSESERAVNTNNNVKDN